eukprot:2243343-Amphidinium_carterae.1
MPAVHMLLKLRYNPHDTCAYFLTLLQLTMMLGSDVPIMSMFFLLPATVQLGMMCLHCRQRKFHEHDVSLPSTSLRLSACCAVAIQACHVSGSSVVAKLLVLTIAFVVVQW